MRVIPVDTNGRVLDPTSFVIQPLMMSKTVTALTRHPNTGEAVLIVMLDPTQAMVSLPVDVANMLMTER